MSSPELGGTGQKWNVGLGMRLTDASAPVSAGAVGCWGWGEIVVAGREKGAELTREGGLLPWLQARQGHSLLALGVLGMVGGRLRGKEGSDEEAWPLPSGLYQEESFQREDGRPWELSRALGPAPLHGGHHSLGCLWASPVPTRASGWPLGILFLCPLQSS